VILLRSADGLLPTTSLVSLFVCSSLVIISLRLSPQLPSCNRSPVHEDGRGEHRRELGADFTCLQLPRTRGRDFDSSSCQLASTAHVKLTYPLPTKIAMLLLARIRDTQDVESSVSSIRLESARIPLAPESVTLDRRANGCLDISHTTPWQIFCTPRRK
jgi:hypothetical protein